MTEDIPFPENHFDAVVSVSAIEFFTDIGLSISEMIRVTKSGGKIVVGS